MADNFKGAPVPDIPLVDPEGNLGTAPANEVQALMQQGFTPPSQEQVQQVADAEKYGSTTEQIKTGLESAASAATFGLSTAAQRMMGADPEAMRKRQEANPMTHIAGQVAGIGGSMLTGLGVAPLMEMAGAKAAKAVAPYVAENALGRVGTAATKAAVENMVFQAGDEASKMFMSDPEQSAETALAHVGMAGALGGILGGGLKGTSELWSMGPGAKIEQVLQGIKNRTSGLPAELKTAADINLAPEIEAVLGGTPNAQKLGAELMETNAFGGRKFQEKMTDFHKQVDEAVAQTLGVDEVGLTKLKDASKHELGTEFKDTLTKSISEKIEPIAKKYEQFETKFAKAEITPEIRLDAANKINQVIVDGGLLKGPNEGSLKLAQKVLNQLDNQATAQDLRNYARQLSDMAPYGSENYQVAKQIKNVLSDAQEASIDKLAAGSADYAAFKATQAEYGEFKGLLEELNDRLHLGREAKYGAKGFMKALREMDGEKVVDRLNLRKSVDLQNILAKNFPEVNELARAQELQTLIKKSVSSSGDNIDLKKLTKQLDALSPELRAQLLTPEQASRIDALQTLAKKVPKSQNPSHSAKTLDMLWESFPASGGAIAGMLLGPGAIAGALFGTALREGPAAIKLATLKFLGSNMPTNAKAFQAAVKAADAMLKGEALLDKSAKAVFTGVSAHIPEPSAKDLSKLAKQVDELGADPMKLLENENNTAHYLPDHSDVVSMAAARNLQYLASLKPNTAPLGPLDPARVANSSEESKYNNALKIAQSPLIVMDRVQKGTLTVDDMKHLNAMYPALGKRMRMKLNTQLIEHKAKDVNIPYATKISLSAFLAQPLDFSLQPQSIMAAQPQMPQVEQQGAGMAPAKIKNVNKLDKLAPSYSTPGQSREASRASKH